MHAAIFCSVQKAHIGAIGWPGKRGFKGDDFQPLNIGFWGCLVDIKEKRKASAARGILEGEHRQAKRKTEQGFWAGEGGTKTYGL